MGPEVARGREAPRSGPAVEEEGRSWGWAASAWRIGWRARAPEDGGRAGAAGKVMGKEVGWEKDTRTGARPALRVPHTANCRAGDRWAGVGLSQELS